MGQSDADDCLADFSARVLTRREFCLYVYDGKAKPANWITVRLINFAINWRSKRSRYTRLIEERLPAVDRRPHTETRHPIEALIIREEMDRVMANLTETEWEIFRSIVLGESERTLWVRTRLKPNAYKTRAKRAAERFS